MSSDDDNKPSLVFKFISSIALPAAIALAGYYVSTSIEESKVDSEYVKLSIGILASAKQADTESSQVLRRWAVKVLDKSSPVGLTEKEKLTLINSDNIYLRDALKEFGSAELGSAAAKELINSLSKLAREAEELQSAKESN